MPTEAKKCAGRSKGQTEDGLTHLGYNDTIIFRPALLKGAKREHFRVAEELLGYVSMVPPQSGISHSVIAR